MKTGNSLLGTIIVMTLLVSVWGGVTKAYADGKKSRSDTVTEMDIVDGNNTFALELFQQLKDEKKGNLFFSPYSISTALAMVFAGAREKPAGQMADTLRFPSNNHAFHSAFGEMINNLNTAGGVEGCKIVVANALWKQKDYTFLDSFLDLVTKSYSAGLQTVDFAATEAARSTINDWVEKQTNDKIQNLIGPGVLNPLTRMVLTNAIYFKGIWAHQFKKKRTRAGTFFITPEQPVTVNLMQQRATFGYGQFGPVQVVEMPYLHHTLAMTVVLPAEGTDLAKVEKTLSGKRLEGWTDRLRQQPVVVHLPRFKMTSDFMLNTVLAKMGMRDAFSQVAADFSGMTGLKDLFISAAVHKAFVEVNEEGTEAAAATSSIMRAKSMPPPAPVFRADRPFLFFIREKRTDSILFIGRLTDPRK